VISIRDIMERKKKKSPPNERKFILYMKTSGESNEVNFNVCTEVIKKYFNLK
jgi:hypothetical protein